MMYVLRKLYVMVTLILLGCTSVGDYRMKTKYREYIDSALEPHFDSFTELMRQHDVPLDRSRFGMFLIDGFSDLTIGACVVQGVYRFVLVSKEFWVDSDFYQKEQLIFHELSHCLIGRDHCKVKDRYGSPVSIMFPSILPSYLYKENRDEYVNELFEKDERCD